MLLLTTLFKTLYILGDNFLLERRAPCYITKEFFGHVSLPPRKGLCRRVYGRSVCALLVWFRFSCLTSWRPSFYFTSCFNNINGESQVVIYLNLLSKYSFSLFLKHLYHWHCIYMYDIIHYQLYNYFSKIINLCLY